MTDVIETLGTGRGSDSVQSHVHAALRRALIGGAYPRGSRLPVRDLARALGVSPTPVREALRRLASEGAVEVLESGAARVPIMRREAYRELVETRVALETLAARRGTAAAGPDDVAQVAAAAEAYSAVMQGWDPARVVTTDHAFHRALYAPGDQAVLLPLIEALQVRSGPVLRELVGFYRQPREDLHAVALDALRRGDEAGVAGAVAADIRRAADYVLENAVFDEEVPPAAGAGR